MNIFRVAYYVLAFPVYAAIVIVVNTVYTLVSFVANCFSNFLGTCKAFADSFVKSFTPDKDYHVIFKSMNDFITFPLTLLSNFVWILLYIIEANIADIVEYPDVAAIIEETINETSDDISLTEYLKLVYKKLNERK